VLATSQVVVDKCEEFLSTYNLSGVLTFINCNLAGSEGVNVGAVPDRMEDSSGEHGVAIKALANHIPRSQPSIAAALLVHFGNAVLYCSLDKANLAADMAELHKGRSEEDNLNSSDLLVITTDAADHEGDRRYVCYRNGN
jgi:galactitol-specific phosphotransferase system IIB component